MKITYKKVKHPNIINREITYLFLNGKIDIPSAKFLTNELLYGGINGKISGLKSHRNKAVIIGELYRHLFDLGTTWDKALESDILTIRNAMLCWSNHNIPDYENYNYKAISNNAMNYKLSLWFKFYKFMEKIGINYNMILSTKKTPKNYYNNFLNHLDNRNTNNNYNEVWSLKVKSSPRKESYHALSRIEYIQLEKKLLSIDLVFQMIAYLMVETGLRVTAALEIKELDFKDLFKYINFKKDINDVIKVDYISKGGDLKKFDLPIRTIIRIKKEYLARIYNKRKILYNNRCNKLNIPADKNVFWITEKGKKVEYHDVLIAFKKSSLAMGRNINITSHWLRHTFATWSLIDFAKSQNLKIENTGITPNPLFIILLREKLGHTSIDTVYKYLATALKVMKLNTTNNNTIMPLESFLESIPAQELVKQEALAEFSNNFNEEKFDLIRYAEKRGFISTIFNK